MVNYKYLRLAKFLFCLSLNAAPSVADILELEGPNRIMPPRLNPPKEEWETKKPQDNEAKKRSKVVDYFTKKHPNLLDQASKHLSKKCCSFIISRDIDGEVDYLDMRY